LLATAKSRGAVDNATLVVGRDLLAPAAPIAGMGGAVGPFRAVVALVVIVSTLLLSYGAYALRTGGIVDRPTTTNSDAR
jgi:hypothetical protein